MVAADRRTGDRRVLALAISVIRIPPPTAACISNGNVFATEVDASQLLPPTTLSSIVSVPSSAMPPPPANLPFGALTAERLPATKLSCATSPRPRCCSRCLPAASVGRKPAARVRDGDIAVDVSVGHGQFPSSRSHRRSQRAQEQKDGCGRTRCTDYRYMTLSEIVTVARTVPGASAIEISHARSSPTSDSLGEVEAAGDRHPADRDRRLEALSPMVITGLPPRSGRRGSPDEVDALEDRDPAANVPGPTVIVFAVLRRRRRRRESS